MFNKDYVFLICQDKVLNDDEEKKLKNNVFEYVNDSLRSFFNRKKIEYTDYYSSKTNLGVYTLMTTCKPTNKNKLFLAMLYEIYAYSLTDDEKIFSSYKYETKEFENENQKMKVYKFKI